MRKLAVALLALTSFALADHGNTPTWEYAQIQYDYIDSSNSITIYWVTPTQVIGPKTDEQFILRDLGASEFGTLLEYAGAHGWELVTVTEWEYIFKRPAD